MNKFLPLTFFLFFICNVSAGNLYISKKDIDTKEYISDCDFLLYDENNHVVDSWSAESGVHEVSNIKNGNYILEERPLIDSGLSRDLSVFHEINVYDNNLEITLYNSKISTPRNLNYPFNFFSLGFFIIFFGFLFIYIGYSKKYIK